MQKLIMRYMGPIIAVLTAAFLAILHSMGRIPFCECGFGIATLNAAGSDTSQHLLDPYSFSHILHGILFYGILHVAFRKMPLRYKFLIATLLEMGWEIAENTQTVIDRYREGTAARGYTGDSIWNSFGDLVMAWLGFWMAWKWSVKWVVAFLIAVEVILLVLIKDNLTLNIIMLLYPIDAIREWQLS